MKLFRTHYRILIYLAVAGIFAAAHYYQPDTLQKLALPFEDLKLSSRSLLSSTHNLPDEVVIVAIDEKSINQYGRWPWNRALVGELLNKLDQASAVGIDIIFSEKASAREDEALAEALENSGNDILGFFFRNKASQKIGIDATDLLENCAYQAVTYQTERTGLVEYPFPEVNIQLLAEAAASCGYVNILPDGDGLYRRYPLGLVHNGYIYPPLAIQALQFHWNKLAEIILDENGIAKFAIGQRVLQQNNRLHLNFYSEMSYSDHTISAADILNSRYDRNYFSNRAILLGATEIGIFDVRPTPISPVTPGILLHATALGNLIDGTLLRSAPTVDRLLLLLSLAAITLASNLRKTWKRYLAYLGLLILSATTICYLLFEHLIWVRDFFPITGAIGMILTLEVISYLTMEKSAQNLKLAFSSYVSPALIKEITKNPESLQLGGELREITTLFTDIRGFTGITEKLEPIQTVTLLNEIHDPMTEIVMDHHGTLDKYIGDAMMVLYNAPVPVENHADHAVASALEMQATLQRINRDMSQKGLPEVAIGIGISSGECVVGNMGSKKRFAYTAIGDSVNLASRLEGLCKQYRVPIIISASTQERLQQDWLLRQIDRVQVKGKLEAVEIFQVLSDSEENRSLVKTFNEALQLYFTADFASSLALFSNLEQAGDRLSGLFVERCRRYLELPPDAAWDGVYVATSK
ncbi:MAG: hypothetical protein C0615_10320 [Desulfuromonas sp.]|nr:MAG: hypothetical protein C0615_10320 [Desulfuromonas sp.]